MEKYEQYKILSYLLNSLKNKNFFKEHLSEIYDWHENYGKNIIKFSWISKEDEEKYTDFKDKLSAQKKQAYEKGKRFQRSAHSGQFLSNVRIFPYAHRACRHGFGKRDDQFRLVFALFSLLYRGQGLLRNAA